MNSKFFIINISEKLKYKICISVDSLTVIDVTNEKFDTGIVENNWVFTLFNNFEYDQAIKIINEIIKLDNILMKEYLDYLSNDGTFVPPIQLKAKRKIIKMINNSHV